jgi:hypothetical protein
MTPDSGWRKRVEGPPRSKLEQDESSTAIDAVNDARSNAPQGTVLQGTELRVFKRFDMGEDNM